ncbi:TetR/AcrR family transcriptional regulator [Rhodococcus sp. IEGM 1379]|uniref:TetR/AcrR family transcriptional regulator n=1 Tax=Rhodococcus sp. IEGM 1379 TaxID=3047086 RepID=UPI0024B6587D|nr:TetR/AcrR family transcriptional regulator [Rhodococcus sp. IEGM 1379]MDI9917546.1 TetR/AcrR family transcriptional regulator [Rhodococcus sp. IEGM 1379]
MSVDVPDMRSVIIRAAADAFATDGYASTTIDDLADRIGATKGLVYYHFRSKFDIYLAVFEHGMSRLRAEIDEEVSAGGTGLERLQAMSRAHLINLMTHLGHHHAIHQGVRGQMSSALKPRQRQALVELNALRLDYENLFEEVMAEGVADGSVRVASPRMAAKVLLSSLNGVDLWYRHREGQALAETEALAEEIVELLIGGLRA